jgi:crossover junction endodeoxyribonuclease RuvC
MKILGIDPGFGRMGYGIILGSGMDAAFIRAGCLETEKALPHIDRLHALYTELTHIIDEEQPELLAVEELFFSKNAKTALKVAEVRGIILILARMRNIPVMELKPLEVKIATCGYGNADKTQVQHMVTNILRLSTIPKPDDAADALAIAITAAAVTKSNRIA